MFGRTAHIGSRLIGEDIEFCHRLANFGFKCYVDCGVVVGHLGLVGFDFRHAFFEAANANAGNDADGLRGEPDRQVDGEQCRPCETADTGDVR